MQFFSSVPLVDEKKCPDNEDHNRLASQVNKRLTRSGPDSAWRIFFYADSIFTGMRNTATPHRPLGVNPPEDEWWKIYTTIEYPVGSSGVGNWPLTLAGTPQGANVMNPLNAFIFGRKTAENKFLEKQGPWAEGNVFDGLVSSSRAVLSNKQYWEDAFMQRGAIARNLEFDPADTTPWEGYSVFGAGRRIEAKYLPNPEDAVFLSTSLTAAAISSDRYFQEYASQHVYMRYPPAIQGGKFIKYMQAKDAPQGVLKRKNAAKDLLQWGLWSYVYYFRGSESQRSVFCSPKKWDVKLVDYKATKQFTKSANIKESSTFGPLNICKVGFDFYKYFTRQNVFAPALGMPSKFKATSGMAAHKAYYELDGVGNKRLEPYRVSFSYAAAHGQGADTAADMIFCKGPVRNYDRLQFDKGRGPDDSSESYGKSIKFTAKQIKDGKDFLEMTCDYDSYDSGKQGLNFLNFEKIEGKGKQNYIKSCIAGYYLETEAIENPNMTFKFRILSNDKVVHETLVSRNYSYRVGRNRPGKKAYIYNKMFYFKEGLVHSGESHKFKFQIVPFTKATLHENDKVPESIGGKVISMGNPYSLTVDKSNTNSGHATSNDGFTFPTTTLGNGKNVIKTMLIRSGVDWKVVGAGAEDAESNDELGNITVSHPSHILVRGVDIGSSSGDEQFDYLSQFADLQDGDMVRVKSYRKKVGENEEDKPNLLGNGDIYFIRRVQEDSADGVKLDRIFFTKRQDDRLTFVGYTTGKRNIGPAEGFRNVYNDLTSGSGYKEDYFRLVIEKIVPPQNIFKVKVDLAILQKRKPTFQDAYALLRVVTAKQNRKNTSSNIVLGDQPGIGPVGHHFSQANRVFRNYFKYGSAINIYGSSAVPVLRQFVSASPIYESMRKFISSFMRFADRQQLINYTVEGGKGVLYFKRFAWGLAKKYRATILRNMEPSIEPAGWFVADDNNDNAPGHSKFIPIREGKRYRVACNDTGAKGSVTYDEMIYFNGQTFKGKTGKDYLDANNTSDPKTQGAFEEDGISSNKDNHVTNNWIMFMTSAHYHSANSNIYKPSIYNDIMGFLNNRCHHRSKEYEDSYGDKYDMIRGELLRIPVRPWNTPGRLQTFLSKSSPNFNYVFNTNDPEQGNVDLYSETGDGRSDYFKSCPAVTPRPYKVTSTRVVNFRGGIDKFNPSSKKIDDREPFEVVKVVLDRPLRGTGRLSVDSRGWAGISPSQLQKEPYRTDENAIIEYLHQASSQYACKRHMIGDYGSDTEAVMGDGYKVFGACFPRFYFLKLIPKVPNGALLDSEPYAQMDFYFRAMSGGFVSPFPASSLYSQTSSLNWKFSEIASRSSEEDPTMFDYVDPRAITS